MTGGGAQYFIDGHEVPRVKSVDFHVAVDEVPTFNFEMMGRPDIEMECLAQISFTSQSIADAISVLRHTETMYICKKCGYSYSEFPEESEDEPEEELPKETDSDGEE